jgi:hypothetical protein
MKSIFFLLLSLLSGATLSAQLTITPGAQFSILSDTKLTLKNIDLVNNGNFLVATTNPVSFTGNAPSFIGGDQAIRFFKLEINKTGDQTVSLHRTISVGEGVFFTAGLLDLNGFDIDLGTTGHLDGEREDSRVIGPNGGNVVFSVNLNSPTNSNPANLGVIFTSDQDLGNVTIKRGHQSQVNIPGAGRSVLRNYNILPTNNTNLNATVRFKYFNGELNGLDENSLVFFKSDDGINWSVLGLTSRDTAANFVEKTGIASLSRLTLSTINNSPLPIFFILFNAECEANKVVLTWKSAQEQNSDHFNVERSSDGSHWTVIGNLPAAGNSANEKTYLFTDNSPVQNALYRIAEYDLDGRAQYTSEIRSSCGTPDMFSLRPNPFHDLLFINITAGSESQATIKVFDSKGALVKVQRTNVLQGSNLINIDLKSMTNGIYHLEIDWNNGQMKRAVHVIKQ